MAYEYAITKQIFDTSNLTPYQETLEKEQEIQDIQEEKKFPNHEEKILDDDILANEEVIIPDEEHPHHKVFDKF